MLELEIETRILDWLAASGLGFFWKNTSGGFHDGKKWRVHQSPFAIRGTSDILGIVNGKFIALEVKTENGRPTSEQMAFIRRVRECGGLASVVKSLHQTEELFQEWGLIAKV